MNVKFIMGWIKYHKVQVGVYISLLALISCTTLLLGQFVWSQSVYEENRYIEYVYVLDEELPNKQIEELVKDLVKNDVDILEIFFAGNNAEYELSGEYNFGSFYISSKTIENERKEFYTYGEYEEKDGYYVGDGVLNEIEIGDETLNKSGDVSVWAGEHVVDYRVTWNDYNKVCDNSSVVSVVVNKECEEKVSEVIEEYVDLYTIEYSQGYSSDGFESVKKLLWISIFLILASLYSALAFVEIFIHMQKKDISVMYKCGAEEKNIRNMYLLEVAILGSVSFVLGSILANIFVYIFEFNYEKINYEVYIISAISFMVMYILEAYVYISRTLRYVSRIRSDTE